MKRNKGRLPLNPILSPVLSLILGVYHTVHCTTLEISGARIITHDASMPDVSKLVTEISRHIPNTLTSAAVMNASMNDASLLNRLLYSDHAKLDTRQIFNTQILGCFMAHVNVWRQIPPQETWLILEDDAKTLPDYEGKLRSLIPIRYSYINLAPSREVKGAIQSRYHPSLRECPQYSQVCHVIGTTAYLLTHDGAQRLLKHASPVDVPVDWYMSSLRDYLDTNFSFSFYDKVFTARDRPSTIAHQCLHCRLPRSEENLYTLIISGSILLPVIGYLLGCLLGCLTVHIFRNVTPKIPVCLHCDGFLETFPVTRMTSGFPGVSLFPGHWTYGVLTKNTEAE